MTLALHSISIDKSSSIKCMCKMGSFRCFRILLAVLALAVVSSVSANSFAEGEPQNDEARQEVVVGTDGTIESMQRMDGEPADTKAAESLTEEVPAEEDSDVREDSKREEEGKLDPNCPARSHIIKCTGRYLDSDQDGRLSRTELDSAIGSLPW